MTGASKSFWGSDAIAFLSRDKGSTSTLYRKIEPNTIFTIIKEAREIRLNNFMLFLP